MTLFVSALHDLTGIWDVSISARSRNIESQRKNILALSVLTARASLAHRIPDHASLRGVRADVRDRDTSTDHNEPQSFRPLFLSLLVIKTFSNVRSISSAVCFSLSSENRWERFSGI